MIVVACIALAAALFTRMHGSADENVRRWADELHARLTPPDATTLDTSPIQREKFAATVTWEIETRQTWIEYGTWVRSKLASDYKLLASKDESTIDAGRTLPGDAQNVRVEKINDGPPLRVRVTFQTIADKNWRIYVRDDFKCSAFQVRADRN